MESTDCKIFGRYMISVGAAADRLSGLSWELDSQRRSVVKWDWPKRREVKLAIVFPLRESEAERHLEELLEQEAAHTICSREIDKHYCKPLGTEQKMCYKVYPAMFGEGNQIIIFDQEKNNTTGLLFVKSKIGCSVDYSKILLSNYKKAELKIHSENAELETRTILMYARYSQGRCICKYPLAHMRMECYIKADEEIRVMVRQEYREQIEIYEVNAKRQDKG